MKQNRILPHIFYLRETSSWCSCCGFSASWSRIGILHKISRSVVSRRVELFNYLNQINYNRKTVWVNHVKFDLRPVSLESHRQVTETGTMLGRREVCDSNEKQIISTDRAWNLSFFRSFLCSFVRAARIGGATLIYSYFDEKNCLHFIQFTGLFALCDSITAFNLLNRMGFSELNSILRWSSFYSRRDPFRSQVVADSDRSWDGGGRTRTANENTRCSYSDNHFQLIYPHFLLCPTQFPLILVQSNEKRSKGESCRDFPAFATELFNWRTWSSDINELQSRWLFGDGTSRCPANLIIAAQHRQPHIHLASLLRPRRFSLFSSTTAPMYSHCAPFASILYAALLPSTLSPKFRR